MPVSTLKENLWLGSKHPAYVANIDLWLQNESRMAGGDEVLDELTPFDWEDKTGAHYQERQNNAYYHNFPDRFASGLVGHMMRQSPQVGNTLHFGTLGKVRRQRDIEEPSRAELVYYNTDGVGNDGSQWNPFWTRAMKGTFPCGFMWVLAENPESRPASKQDEIDGLRPFLTEYSPTVVPNWDFEKGQLSFAIIVRTKRVIEVDGDAVTMRDATEYLVLVRKGYGNLGSTFTQGGWFIFNEEGGITDRLGDFRQTKGEIPMVALFYERVRPTKLRPSIARPAITEIGAAAISYMNTSSAADFEVWDAAGTVKAVEGVDEEAFNLFIAKIKGGNRYSPLKNNKETGKTPSVSDISADQATSNIFDLRLRTKRQEVAELMLNEIQTAPYASGASKKVSFMDSRSPRLALLASELETAQNAMIRFLELMFGARKPSGSVEWEREFDLVDAGASALEFFTIEEMSGYKSPTAGAKVMMMAVKALGIAGDDQQRTLIEQEYMTSAQDFVEEHKLFVQNMITQRASAIKGSQGTPKKPASMNPPALA